LAKTFSVSQSYETEHSTQDTMNTYPLSVDELRFSLSAGSSEFDEKLMGHSVHVSAMSSGSDLAMQTSAMLSHYQVQTNNVKH